MVSMPGFGNVDNGAELVRNLSFSATPGHSPPTGSQVAEPSAKIFATPPPLFALIVGINEYASDDIEDLEGAVADAQAMKSYLETWLGVQTSQIKTLFNKEATRAAIIASLRNLKHDSRINRGDPILIYYAGHGSTADAPVGWGSGGSEIQILVPHDALYDPNDNLTHGIPDRTIGVLLEQIAQEKDDNITVIFDCCHSGSLTRKTRCDRSNKPRVRGVKMPVKIPPELDVDIWGGTRGMATAPGFLKSGLRSHVLLSACGAEEKAKEVLGRGYFTKSLLETLKAVGADKVTYAELVQRIPCQPAQNPQCEGVKQDRICFNSMVPVRSSRMHPVRKINQHYVVNAGTIHGITEGATFGLYNDENVKPTDHPVATLKASKPKAFSTYLISSPQDAQLDINDRAFALLLRAGVQEDIRIHVELDEKQMKVFQALATEVEIDDPAQPKFMLVELKETAELEISSEDNRIVFNILDPLVTIHGLIRLHFSLPPTCEMIGSILRKAAHYFWHLRRSGSVTSLQGKVEVEFLRLQYVEGEYDDDLNRVTKPCGPDLVHDGVIDIVLEENAIYGVKLTNKSGRRLYPYLFYFDNSDLSITSYFQPGTSSGKVDAPLRPKGSFTIGYGSGGIAPFDYTLREGQDVDVGFLKLFISTDPVNLSGIPQSSPLREGNRKLQKGTARPIGDWSTHLITIVQRRYPSA